MGSVAEEQFVLEELLKISDQYNEYERLAQLAVVASQSFVTDGPMVDTARHPVGLVFKTHF